MDGGEYAVAPEELYSVTESLTGLPPKSVASREIGGNVGLYRHDGPAKGIYYDRNLNAAAGLLDPTMGLPTMAGLRDAAGQYGNALLMGTTAPSGGAMMLASRNPRINNAPVVTQRPFATDYPSGAPADATGRLTADIEGQPLTAPLIAGRRVLEAPDSALTSAELDAAAEGITGRIPEAATSRELREDAGPYRKVGEQARIYYDRSLAPSNIPLVSFRASAAA